MHFGCCCCWHPSSPLPLVFHGSWRWISTHRCSISIIERCNPTKNNILDAMKLFNLWFIISAMVKCMLVALVVVVVSHQLSSSLHQKRPMYLHMQLHERPIQINPANFIYMRPCFIAIAYLFASNFVLVPNGTPCKLQLNFLAPNPKPQTPNPKPRKKLNFLIKTKTLKIQKTTNLN